jgi:transposase
MSPKKNQHQGRAYDVDVRERVVKLRNEGEHPENIQKFTGVSISSQRRYLEKNKKGESLSIKKPNRKLFHHSQSKITEEYVEKLLVNVAEREDLKLFERVNEMEELTGIKISESNMSNLLKKLNVTKKKKTKI